MIAFIPSRNPYLTTWTTLHTWHLVALAVGDIAMAAAMEERKRRVWLESVA